MAIEVDETRFVEMTREQAEVDGMDGGGLHRLTFSDGDAEIRAWFTDQALKAGLELTVDGFGDMFDCRERTDPDVGTILMGSHLDPQPYGGIHDSTMGIVAVLELVRAPNDKGIEMRRPIEVVSWTNEESSRFQPIMQGSGVWVGGHDIEAECVKTDADGEVFEEGLERISYKGDVPAEPQRDYDSYLELHIKQGPHLEEGDADMGIVTGIVGLTWGVITFHGETDHSGPTPMHYRSDILVAVADAIIQIRRIPDTLGERTVGATGYIDAKPNSINIIPGEVTFTWEFRDPDEVAIEEARACVFVEAEVAAEREGVNWEYEDRMQTDPVRFANGCVDTIELAIEELDCDGMCISSGAGCDATHTHRAIDTGVVLLISEDGKSHGEDEYTSWDDCYKATNTLANAAYELATE